MSLHTAPPRRLLPARLRRALLACICALGMAQGAAAADLALGGMDAVSYRTEGRAVPGRQDMATFWSGEEWHFKNDANRTAFESNPRAYAPGFDGYCPVALAEGRQTLGNPQNFVIIGAQLYLLETRQAMNKLMAHPRQILMRAKQNFVRSK